MRFVASLCMSSFMIGACSTGYIRGQITTDRPLPHAKSTIDEAFYVIENEMLRLYVKASSRGSRFVIDDESSTFLLLSIPTDRLDSQYAGESGYGFFEIHVFGPPFMGYMKVNELRLDRKKDTISFSASMTSTFVFTGRGESMEYQVRFSGVSADRRDKTELPLDSFYNEDFSAAFAQEFGKPWEGPQTLPSERPQR